VGKPFHLYILHQNEKPEGGNEMAEDRFNKFSVLTT